MVPDHPLTVKHSHQERSSKKRQEFHEITLFGNSEF